MARNTKQRTPNLKSLNEFPELPVKGSKTVEYLYVMGGYSVTNRSVLSSISRYDTETKQWSEVGRMPYPLCDFSCVAVGDKIYVCGGYNGRECPNHLLVLDTNTDKWSELKSMKYGRTRVNMVELDGWLYVSGSQGNHMDSCSKEFTAIERYSIEENRWESIPGMRVTDRVGFDLLAMDGFLYIIGGYDDVNSLRSVRRYDPGTNTWGRIADTNNAFVTAYMGINCSTVFDNRLYVIGRYYCEEYDPTTNKWTLKDGPGGRELPLMNLIKFDGTLCAIGGHSWVKNDRGQRSLRASTNVKYYHAKKNQWMEMRRMNIPRAAHGVAVVRKCFQS